MDKSFLVYDRDFVLEVCKKWSDDWSKKRFTIPSSVFGEGINSIIRHFVKKQLKVTLEELFGYFFMVEYSYDGKNIFVLGGIEAMKEVTLLFPYGEYDKYCSVVKKINDLVSNDGAVALFVDNNPYSFTAGVCIHTSKNYEEIIQLSQKEKLTIDHSIGIQEIISGLMDKHYSMASLPPEETIDVIQVIFEGLFYEQPKSYYKKSGYSFEQLRKKKIFVSYCHKNKEQVYKIIEELRSFGLDFWLDEEQIDFGDRLLERIDEGMRECDIPIIFISHATKEALFAQHELKTFFSQIIYQKSSDKKWFIVKLDDVNPNDILLGLGDFKYFDMEEYSVEELANRLKIKIEK
ncbi:toll/interleukin-1 receptor domain-containing protein [Enterococcus faecalis]|uniref:toll/interleukin-1 receptor domain-containing protein n=1 Tax=Enterococcus faecalis TaxID=1351 RepID=UPI003CC52358